MNLKRAAWAREAALVFAKSTGLNASADGYEMIIGDLVGDLLHLAKQEGLDPEYILSHGHDHFLSEYSAGD